MVYLLTIHIQLGIKVDKDTKFECKNCSKSFQNSFLNSSRKIKFETNTDKRKHIEIKWNFCTDQKFSTPLRIEKKKPSKKIVPSITIPDIEECNKYIKRECTDCQHYNGLELPSIHCMIKNKCSLI
jgi:hypothetical protein